MLSLVVTVISLAAIAHGQGPVDDQQPQFHPGPPTHWMNDPNGPMYYKGYYHLFFQYNPLGPNWGHMSWGHIISKDLAHWSHLPVALSPDMDYDKGGVFTGSATIRDDGSPIIVYTCVGHGQLQCIALPNDTSDPTLTAWHKPPQNPVIAQAPPGGTTGQFRDDTTAWKVADGSWRMVVGASIKGVGSASLWRTTDFYNWTYVGVLANSDTNAGMWECPDFYPTIGGEYYVLKYSAGGDWYRLGSFNVQKETFQPSTEPARYDYGQFYASKRFYDPVKKRQILYGWSAEEDHDASARGWQGHQTLPRSVTVDSDLKALLFNPVEELQNLRKNHTAITNIKEIAPGTVTLLENVEGLQLDIILVVKIPEGKSSLGVAVRATEDLRNMTSILAGQENLHGPLNNTDMPGDDYHGFTYPPNSSDQTNMQNCSAACTAASECVAWTYVRQGDPKNPRCALKNGLPAMRQSACCISGSKNNSVVSTLTVNRTISGGPGSQGSRSGPIAGKPADTEMTLRVLVDHSMIEAIAQNGRTCVTAHVYTDASANRVALVNFGSTPVEVVSLDIYEMDSCWIPPP